MKIIEKYATPQKRMKAVAENLREMAGILRECAEIISNEHNIRAWTMEQEKEKK